MTFKEYYIENIDIGMKKRHMNPIGRDASSHSKHPGRFVPHMHRTVKKNQKVESLLNKPSGKMVLNVQDIAEIEKEFNLNFDQQAPKKLGNTGITIKFDPILYKAILEK
jgi:hypothetical protein